MSKNKSKIKKYVKRLSKDKLRLSVFRSNTNIYAQIIDDKTGKTVVSSNSLKLDKKPGTAVAQEVGADLAKKAVKNKITNIYLDRGSLRYEGRLKALCESIRDNGVPF